MEKPPVISRGLRHIGAVPFISGFHPEPRKGRVP